MNSVRFGSGLVVATLAVSACVAPAASTSDKPSVSTQTHVAQQLNAMQGITLPAGWRSGAYADSYLWVVTQPAQDASLLLSRVDARTGDYATYRIVDSIKSFSGAGVAADGVGHIWLAYGNQALMIDEATATVEATHQFPMGSTAAEGGDGDITAVAWDDSTQSLLVLKNRDSHIYRVDAVRDALTIVATTPIIAGPQSHILVAESQIYATGGLSQQNYQPGVSAVSVAGTGTTAIPGVLTACLAGADPVGVMQDGSIVPLSPGTVQPWGHTSFTNGTTVFACDNAAPTVYSATAEDGKVTARRIVSNGETPVAAFDLVKSSAGGMTGAIRPNPSSLRWINPGLAGILPDGSGGLWLLFQAGSQVEVSTSPTYPSLVHVPSRG